LILLDANVLLYAYHRGDPHHAAARAFLEGTLNGDEPVGIPWVSIVAFVRIVTNPRVYERPMTISEACEIVDSWFARPNVVAISPAPRHWNHLRALLIDGQATANLASDAHLAALALENGATLVTTDRDFSRFSGLRLRGLT